MPRLILIPLLPLAALAACHRHAPGDAEQGKALIASHCVACHTVPGVAAAKGKVGPPLTGIARREIIAGKYQNNRANLERWIMHPQAMLPGTAMPDMGLNERQAHAIADYLYTLDGK